jgi:Metallo-beta-lactamase superfamily domain
MFRVTPLYGSSLRQAQEIEDEEAASPVCTMIEYDDQYRILWNVGWTFLQQGDLDFGRFLPPMDVIDGILISDSSLQALGGLPMLLKDSKTSKNATSDVVIPIYTTLPVVKMGQMNLYDQHAALVYDGCTPYYDLHHVDSIFGTVEPYRPSLAKSAGSSNSTSFKKDEREKPGADTSIDSSNTTLAPREVSPSVHLKMKSIKYSQTVLLRAKTPPFQPVLSITA